MITAWNPSLLEKQICSQLFLCILVQGPNAQGEPCYAYFGLTANQLPELTRIAASGRPFNPKDLGAVVVACSTGEPTQEIRDLMGRTFLFSEDSVVLQVSIDQA